MNMFAAQFQEINFPKYKQPKIIDRAFSFSNMETLITNDLKQLNWEVLGKSHQGRPIRMVSIGEGRTKVLLWSQMHGDEPTATAAIFDLLNFMQSAKAPALRLLKELTIHFIPVVNPDGMETYTRRNAQLIDINRDYLALQSPEARILKNIFEQIKPDFAFNLHDQSSLYCHAEKKAIGISFLAPAADEHLAVTWNREQAMKLIVVMNHKLQKLIPNQVARYKDDFEPRAFGDNFQKTCPLILIESGFLPNDLEKQYIRELNFHTLLTALGSISSKSYQEVDLLNYLMIPLQSQDLFHIKIKNCKQTNDGETYKIDLGLIQEEVFNQETRTFESIQQLADLGDLSTREAYEVIDATDLIFSGELKLEHPADIELWDSHGLMLYEWKSGRKI